MGAKKVFEADDESVILSSEPTPWTIDNLIYLDLEIWQTLIEFVRQFSEADAEQLERYGRAGFGEHLENRTPEHLMDFRRILEACLQKLETAPERLHTVMAQLELENPLIDDEYKRILQIFLTFLEKCLKKKVFYSAWTE
ncbi:hypothetical protein [Deinococcus multiflagellatus]|uniref:Uncharacterized protein n=1 Tax=Deinococcus multiflagellatus TaxID=1656887 RepID=A0ABW1ZMQ6_9DEIO|nr:hypothetical protein [Deinococcus multiflagellatus]MBZ9715160.1 hypothetical protein [Deinococcus multiflagellatus]